MFKEQEYEKIIFCSLGVQIRVIADSHNDNFIICKKPKAAFHLKFYL